MPPRAPSPPGSDDEPFPDTDELTRRACKVRREAELDDLRDRINGMRLPDDETLRARFDRGTTPAARTGAKSHTTRRSRRDDYDNDLDPTKFDMYKAYQEGTRRKTSQPATPAGQENPFAPKPQKQRSSPPMPGCDAPGYAGGPPFAPDIPNSSRSRSSAPRSSSIPRQPSQTKPRREPSGYPPQANYQRPTPTGPAPEYASPPPQPPRRPVPGFQSAPGFMPQPMPGYPMPPPPPMPGYPPPPRHGPMPGYAPGPGPYGAGPVPGHGSPPGFAPGPQRTRSRRRPGHSSRRRAKTSTQSGDIVPEIWEPESDVSDEEPQKLLKYK